MFSRAQATIAVPQSLPSDARIYEILDGLSGLMSVVVAQEIGFFELLASAPATTTEIALRLGLRDRGARVLVTVCGSLGLIQLRDSRYQLTPFSSHYLLKRSPTSYTTVFEFIRAHSSSYTIDRMRNALLSGAAVGTEGARWHERLLVDPVVTERFIEAMHEHSRVPATVWPRLVDLGSCSRLLDIGAGSGVHGVEAAVVWPHLDVTLFDVEPVCRLTRRWIASRNLEGRVKTLCGDFWLDPLPDADVHLYSDVFHDWSLEDCRKLAAKSFAALSPGGRILIHEMLLNEDLLGPFAVASSSASMLLWSEGQQFSAKELECLLKSVGFGDTNTIPTHSCWAIVTGVKR